MRYLSNLYNATFKKIRGKASQGWIRPTLGQFFKTNKDFTEITSDPLLTYPGSTHRESEVTALGGEVFNTGNGTIGRVPLSSVPSGWTQAENWQKYSRSSWGGDQCGRHKSTGPTTFSNTVSVLRSPGTVRGRDYYSCSQETTRWHKAPSGSNGDVCQVNTSNNPTTNRLEIGIY